ncbi:DUF2147 domain-containing protein [Treponema pedis]|nr:DUF2147 domain-containing protein [Treponema pedis]QOW62055.1 DUF2147 domain-containing protein [Treponema pedis]QSI04994.1 DUF2147 domain-containing protein [Treponema pedis]
MKNKFFFILLFFITGTFCLFSDPVEGLWKSIDEKTNKVTGVWKIYEKDGMLFGEMLMTNGHHPQAAVTACKESYKDFPKPGRVNKMPLVGTPFIYNLIKKSEGYWHKGYIIDPASGKHYYCKIIFHKADDKKYKKDTLEMRGEIGLGIGRSQYWEKTDQAETDELIKNNTVEHKYELATE